MNASNNDYWVGDPEVDYWPTFLEWFSAFPRRGARGTKRDCKNNNNSLTFPRLIGLSRKYSNTARCPLSNDYWVGDPEVDS